MSTRSFIVVKYEGYYEYVYCHFDGNPEHHFPILQGFYSTPEQVKELISLGDMSDLDKSVECPPGHSFVTPVNDYCIFYGRDRGDKTEDLLRNICYPESSRKLERFG